jgi:CrcB protein
MGAPSVIVLVWAGVVVAGGVGAVLRFLVDGSVGRLVGKAFPFGTLVVNVSGAVVLGLVSGLVLGPNLALIAGTGVIGSYTTFSTWMLESHRLAEEGQSRLGVINIVISVALGIGGAALGRWLGGLV